MFVDTMPTLKINELTLCTDKSIVDTFRGMGTLKEEDSVYYYIGSEVDALRVFGKIEDRSMGDTCKILFLSLPMYSQNLNIYYMWEGLNVFDKKECKKNNIKFYFSAGLTKMVFTEKRKFA